MIDLWLSHAERDVSNFRHHVPHLIELFSHLLSHFRGGQIGLRRLAWEQLTSDPYVLGMVSGVQFSFVGDTPCRHYCSNARFSSADTAFLQVELNRLISLGVICETQHESDEFVSPIFLVDKKDGGKRLILNLKDLNPHLEYHHFKMHDIAHILSLVTHNCYMSVIDIKDAYYSVPIHPRYQRYLKFAWGGRLYKFLVLPNGLSPAPRKFTKLSKAPLSWLRELHHIISMYIDDSYLQGTTFEACCFSVIATLRLFLSLGLFPHPTKSVFLPSQQVDILGFHIDSRSMTVTLTAEKRDRIMENIRCVLSASTLTIRSLAQVIGQLVAAFPAVRFGPLFFRHLEDNKCSALKLASGDYDGPVSLSDASRSELCWWLSELPGAFAPIGLVSPRLDFFSDASNTGWGARFRDMTARGSWTPAELAFHINVREMMAVLFGLKSLCGSLSETSLRLNVDNTSTVQILKHMGTSHCMHLNRICKDIWLWAKDRAVWLFPVYIASANNPADFPSREVYIDAEWQLAPCLFRRCVRFLGFLPTIDLFASRTNTHLPLYVSYLPDPEALTVDAFSLDWSTYKFYAFPPFSLVSRCLQKIRMDKATGIIVVPRWPTQPFYSLLNQMLLRAPLVIPPAESNLLMPDRPGLTSAISGRTPFLACLVSGKP